MTLRRVNRDIEKKELLQRIIECIQQEETEKDIYEVRLIERITNLLCKKDSTKYYPPGSQAYKYFMENSKIQPQESNSICLKEDDMADAYQAGWIAYLLHIAAEADNITAFTCIMRNWGYTGILWESQRKYNDIMDFDARPTELYITRKPVFLEIIQKYKREDLRPYGFRGYMINGTGYSTDAPSIYVAILDGDVDMVRYMISQGEELPKDCFIEAVCRKRNTDFLAAEERPSDFAGFQAISYEDTFYFYDALTVASYSQNPNMVSVVKELLDMAG